MTDRQRRRRLWAISLLIGVAVFAIVWGVRRTGALQGAELWAYDHLRQWQPRDMRLDGLITLVVLNEDEMEATERDILTDDEVSGLFEKLLSGGAKVVGFDIYRNHRVTSGWDRLNALLKAHDNIVTIAQLALNPTAERPLRIRPPPGSAPEGFGLNDEPQDFDKAVRRTFLAMEVVDDNGKIVSPTYPSFALRLAMTYLRTPLSSTDDEFWREIKLGGRPIRLWELNDGGYIARPGDQPGYQILHDFKGPWDFRKVTVEQVKAGTAPPDAIKDKIVIIGNISESMKDLFVTPVSPEVPGLVLHATQVDQLLRIATRGAPVTSVWSDRAEAWWTLLWSVIGGIIGMLVRAPLKILFAAVVALATLIAMAMFAFFHALWIPLIPPLIGLIASGGLVTAYIAFREQQEWKALMKLFGRSVDPQVALELWDQRDKLLEGGRLVDKEMFVTILFSDLQGFTSTSRNMQPGEVMNWLNEYMNSMSQAVTANRGFINKYMGDGMMAVFGVPVPRESDVERRDDAERAVKSALEMRRRFKQLCAGWPDRHVRVRVGVYSGNVVSGSMGSADRMEYTTVGDTVNTASRFENYRKDDERFTSPDIMVDDCRILIGGPTFNLIDGKFRTQFLCEDELTGRKGLKVAIYSVAANIDGGDSGAEARPADSFDSANAGKQP
jgi:adenylate cyclase